MVLSEMPSPAPLDCAQIPWYSDGGAPTLLIVLPLTSAAPENEPRLIAK